MGIYVHFIFPRLLNRFMAAKGYASYRSELLQQVQGKILEVGFGSGSNLPYYPDHIRQIHAIAVNPGMKQLALKQTARSPIQVHFHNFSAEQLPFSNASFDTVVSTWTLCSIADIRQALIEIHRVLKPEGQFLFVEPGLSPEPGVQKWQHRLTPIQKFVADGCHLNRNIEALLLEAGFKLHKLRKEYTGSSKVGGYFYLRVALK